MVQINLSTKQKQTHRQKTDLWLPGVSGGGNVVGWEFGLCRCKLLHLEWINNKVLIIAQETIHYSVINSNGKEYFKKCIHVYN